MTQDKWEYASNYVGVTTDDGVYRKVADVRVAEYAALLWSAPELLAALEGVVEQLGDLLSRYNLEDYTALDAAHAAIARANGGQ